MDTKKRAKAILMGDDACALACIIAARELLGSQYMGWEPETIRLELDDEGVEIRDENFDALMAGITLQETSAFYWDANVFENVCVALNAESPQFNILHELAPAQIAWGVEQAQAIVEKMSDLDLPEDLKPDDRFDYEPVEYTVASCLHAGMITVPDELSFARERLEERTCAEDSLVSEVKKAWSDMDHSRLEEYPFGEDAVGVQLALMASIVVYCKDERRRLNEQLAMLQED